MAKEMLSEDGHTRLQQQMLDQNKGKRGPELAKRESEEGLQCSARATVTTLSLGTLKLRNNGGQN